MNREIPPLEAKRRELERRVSRDSAVLRRKQELLSRSSTLLADCNAMLAKARAGDALGRLEQLQSERKEPKI